MKTLIARAPSAARPLVLLAALLTCPAGLCLAEPGARPAVETVNYATPSTVVGDILPMRGDPKKVLFRFRRTAEETGATVNVCREYTYPDGSVAVRSRLRYERGRLRSMETEELQTGEKGVAMIRADPKNPARQRLFFEYTVGQGAEARKSTASEVLENDTLADDMIVGFISSHWEALNQGTPVKFRYIALSRKETVGFKLVRESEALWHGTPAVRVRMEPTSFIIAQLVDPMFFVMEKNAPHRVFEYIGRTAPLLKDGGKWKDLDADTVFQWEPVVAGR